MDIYLHVAHFATLIQYITDITMNVSNMESST